jgi:hypothetical protein
MPESTEPASQRDLKPVAPVLDPAISAEARDLLRHKIKRADREAAGAAGGCGFFLSVVGAFTLFVLHFASGLSWWWMLASALPLAVGIASMPALGTRLDDQDRSRLVRARDLDELCREHMFRAQRAIRGVLESRVYASDSLGQAVQESVLRRHEWEIASALREITRLRSELEASTKDNGPGPLTAKVLQSQRHALLLATKATATRIDALERYAREIEMADAAERDWHAAVAASGHNDQYLDLIARTAADEQAVAEIKALTAQAAAAAQVFREHLHQASLAAEALVLPPAARPDLFP